MITLRKRLARGLRREDGAATLEFVLMVPLLFTIFMASFESGLLMVRSVLLEQAVDRTVREVRLGRLPNATHGSLKTEICDLTSILANCEDRITIEMIEVEMATWALPTTAADCIDRAEVIDPTLELNTGDPGSVMLMRVCVRQDPLFPTTGIGLRLQPTDQGGYGLLATSAFTNEP